MEVVGKKLSELRVVDLRQILEKKGLEKSGNKSILIERLSKSLGEEGHDPIVYTFDKNEEAANESQLSEASHCEEDAAAKTEQVNDDTGDLAQSKESVCDEDEELVCEEIGDAAEPEPPREGDEDDESSLQDSDKMVELDSITAEQLETDIKEESHKEAVLADAESGIANTSGEEETEAVIDVDTATVNNVQQHTSQISGNEQPLVTDTTNNNDQSTQHNEEVKPTDGGHAPLTLSEKISNETPPVESEGGTVDDALVDAAGDDDVDESSGPVSDKTTMDTGGDQLVVHVDESDTNLDYDLGDKPEERDAPTPTKDESMDVDAADIVISEGNSATPGGQDNKGTTESGSTSGQASKSSSDLRPDAPKKDAKDLAASQNLWISGLSSLTRATDLKAVFSKHGKVVGAKVVTNANRPGAKCYGYVTMSSSEEAAKCIQNLHRTELHGRMISVEKAKSDPATQARAAAAAARKPPSTEEKKKDDSTTAAKDAVGKDDSRSKAESHRSHVDDKSTRHSDRLRSKSATSSVAKKEGEPAKEGGDKKTEEKEKKPEPVRKAEEFVEREKRKLRAQERRAREEEYRQRTALMKDRRMLAEQQRRFRHDQQLMERERDKLRLDREKIKIEELKLDTLQGERARLENQLIDLRQRVDREREELKRVEILRLEEMRRATTMKRPYDSSSSSRGSGGRYDDGWESKRPATNDRYTSLTSSSDRRSGERGGSFNDRRGPSDMDRRSATVPSGVKEMVVDSRSGRPDERYSSRSGLGERPERRDFPTDSRGRGTSRSDWKQPSDSRGVGRNYHESSSRRSGGSGEGRPGWNGGGSSAGAPSLLAPSGGGGGGELFTGAAAVQAAGMMMSAAMSRGGGSTTNGTSSRYGGSSGGGGYSGGRRY